MEIDKFKKKFGPEAKNYTKYRTPYPQELYELFFHILPKGSKKILDIACGTGKSTEPLVREGLEVYGCDHDPLMIKEAESQAKNKNLDIKYALAETEKLPYEDGCFDAITIGTALHFFLNEMAMSEIKRVLKNKGLLFVFWTLTTKEIPDEDSIPGSIYRSFGWIKIPSLLRDLKNTSAFLDKSSFKNVSIKNIPFIYNTTVEERVNLQTTSGAYELLSTEDKNKFLNEIRSVLTINLGNREYFQLEEEIQVCHGFKG